MLGFVKKYKFSFFNSKISTKYGEKCCRYNQNGKPLDPETVSSILETIKPFVKGWKLNESSTILYRYFFTEDYPMGVQFIKEIAKIDALSTKNCPSFQMIGGEILKLELYSPPLKGLSQLDFQLAMSINKLNFDEFFLIPLESLENYRAEVQSIRFKRQSDDIQRKLREDAGVA
jgi:pterin-4a-carbinolamine dehydratase